MHFLPPPKYFILWTQAVPTRGSPRALPAHRAGKLNNWAMLTYRRTLYSLDQPLSLATPLRNKPDICEYKRHWNTARSNVINIDRPLVRGGRLFSGCQAKKGATSVIYRTHTFIMLQRKQTVRFQVKDWYFIFVKILKVSQKKQILSMVNIYVINFFLSKKLLK